MCIRDSICALGVRPDFAPAWHFRGDIYRLRGEDDIALRFYSESVSYQPSNAMAFVRIGNLLLKRGDWARGLASLRTAQTIDTTTGQLDRIRPGLRRELDGQILKMTTPQQAAPAPHPASVEGSAGGGETVPEQENRGDAETEASAGATEDD